MSITISFGWWLLPLFLSIPFVYQSMKLWLNDEQKGIGGALNAMFAMVWMIPPLLFWLIYFAIMYFMAKAGAA